MAEKEYYTYMVHCRDGTLYSGFTTDMKKRLAAHNDGSGAKYTRSRRPVRLVWSYIFTDEGDARSCEYRLKKLTRRQKKVLANGRDADPTSYDTILDKLLNAIAERKKEAGEAKTSEIC